jgi:mono/diheme cytochrome c family protein
MLRFLRDALVTLVVAAVVLLVVGYASLNRLVFSSAPPGAAETSLARRARNLAIPADARNARNPLAGQKDAWRQGLDHYAEHCESCHAYDGHGGGEIGRHLNPRTPDMALPATQQLTDGELFYIIQNGVRWTGMPAWKTDHTPEESWRLVSFVRHIPSLTPQEMREIVVASGHEHAHDEHDEPKQ